MKIKKVIFIVLGVILSTLAKAQTSDVTEGCAPLVVSFTAPVGPTTWFWDFKDGATSNIQNPNNTFTTPGTYIVEFHQTSTGPIVGTVTIKVYPKPDPILTATTPTKGCVPLNVTMGVNTILPGGVTLSNYNWTFGDGNGGSGTPASHVYNTPGIFSVSIELTTNSPSCNITKIFPNFISASLPPITSFSTNPNPPSACVGPLTVAFTNNSSSPSSIPLTYSWNMGNGNTYTTQNPPSQTYSVNGTYVVVLIASDTNNCSVTTQQNVTIGQPHSSFSLPDTVCINTLVSTIQNLSTAGTSFWNFGPGVTYVGSSNSNSFQPQVQFNTPGFHTIQLITAAGGCSDDTTLTVFVENPTVTFTTTPAYSCNTPAIIQYNGISPNNVATWNWSFGSGLQNPIHTYDLNLDSADIELGEKVYPATVTITTAAGCTATFTSNVKVHPPWARFIPDVTKGCAPLTVTFYDSTRSIEPITNWLWNYDDGSALNSLASGAPHSHTFTTPGEYDVILTITNNLGCKDTSYAVRIEVGGPKVLDFTVDKVDVCPGEAIAFTNLTADSVNVDAWHYSSSGELLSHCFTEDNPTFVFNGVTGPQSITLTAEYNGCYSTITKPNLINVKGPIAGFDYLINCSTPYDIQLRDTSQSATSLLWDFGDGTATSTSGGTFTHTYATFGDYPIILTATNSTSGCPISKDTVVAHIRNIKANFVTGPLLCGGVSFTYDGSASIDVGPSCYRGYSWIFSDPNMRPLTSSSPSTPISFGSSGPQTVGLVVEDVNGCRDTLIQDIRVYNLQPSIAVNDQTICLPSTISFSSALSTSDTTIASYSWNFGDGTPASGLPNPSHTYTSSAGTTFTASLTITNVLGCSNTVTKVINIYTPTSTISSIPNICLGQAVNLSATDFTSQGSNLSYSWNFGDGNFGTGNNLTHTYATSGSHTVTLTFTETATGCTGTTTATVNIQDYPVASYTSSVDGQTVLCNPQQVTFTNTTTSSSPTSIMWDWGAGTSFSPGLSLVFATGTHTVSLVASTSFGCKDTVTKVLNVVGPEGDFTMSINNICKGDPITFTLIDTLDVGSYAWDFGDGTSISDVSPVTHIYNFLPPSGQTVAKLTVYGKDNVCPVTVQQTVFIHYVKADFTMNNNSTDTVLCLGEGLLLTNTSQPATGNLFTWTLGDGATSTSNSSFTHVYTTPGTFNTTLIAVNTTFGCRDTTTKAITIAPLPVITAIGDSVCKFNTAQLSVANPVSNSTYSWTPAAPLSNSNIYNPTVTGINSTYYTVTVVDSNSCSNSDSALVYVVPPLVGFTFDTTIVIGDFVNLPISDQNGTLLFTWTPETGLSCLTCSYPRVQPLADITYTLDVADIYGCFTATDYFNIHVRPETFIDLPTTFTPNGDGTNDIIYVKGWGIKDLLSFQIYNRWGELVFETSELAEGWNGNYKGMLQNNDVYVYKVKATDWRDKEIQKEGHINLMR